MRETFDLFMDPLIDLEGGYVNHPQDRGGPTNKGVTLRVYQAYEALHNRPKPGIPELKKISNQKVKDIYHEQYWMPIWGDQLPLGIDMSVLDTAINSGVGQAVKLLQRAVGTNPDSDMGVITLKAVEVAAKQDEEGLINRYLDSRLAFMKRLDNWDTFGKGWTSRVKEVRKRSLALARSDNGIAYERVTPQQTKDFENAKAPPQNVDLSKTGSGQATGTAASGAIVIGASEAGKVILEQTDKFLGFAKYIPWLSAVGAVLVLIGVFFIVRGLLKRKREGSLG
jgi:lysozyme family protein